MKNAAIIVGGIILAFLINACRSLPEDHSLSYEISKDDTLYICDASLINQSVVQTKLSDWITDFKIVRLEDSDSALVRGWRTYISDNYIGISDEASPFKLFNHQGQFLGCIGRIGQGPGEYNYVYDAALNEENNRICLGSMSGPLQEYDIKGNFVRRLGEGFRLNKPGMRYEKDGSFTTTHLVFTGVTGFQYLRVEKDSSVVPIPPIQTMMVAGENHKGSTIGFNNELWNWNNMPYLTYQISAFDTLYAFKPDTHETYPSFTLKNHPNTFCLYNETPFCFLVSVFPGTDWISPTNTIMVNKQEKRSYYLDVKNDFAGNLPVTQLATSIKNGWYYQMFEPYELLDLIDERLSGSDCSDKDCKVLEELKNSIDENGNNIMFIGKLKEHFDKEGLIY